MTSYAYNTVHGIIIENEEPTTAEGVVDTIANSASCDFITMLNGGFADAQGYSFIATIHGDPEVFYVTPSDAHQRRVEILGYQVEYSNIEDIRDNGDADTADWLESIL